MKHNAMLIDLVFHLQNAKRKLSIISEIQYFSRTKGTIKFKSPKIEYKIKNL